MKMLGPSLERFSPGIRLAIIPFGILLLQWHFATTVFALAIGADRIDDVGDVNTITTNTYELYVQFSADYGLYAGMFVGIPKDTATYKMMLFKHMMLSTMHSRTFVVNGGTGKCPDAKEPFCRDHEQKFDPELSKSLTSGPLPMTGEMEDKGEFVQDTVYFQNAVGKLLGAKGQTIGLMNWRVAKDERFWGTKWTADGNVIDNGADGCFSLWAGQPEDAANFGPKTPLQNIFDNYNGAKPIIAIKMENGKSNIGEVHFGEKPEMCGEWHETRRDGIDQRAMPSWHLQFDIVRTVGDAMANQTAVIDTTTEHIRVPTSKWQEFMAAQMRECDPNKLPTLDFVSGDRTFRVPPFAYFGEALRSGKCAHLVGNSRDDKWHLGMPFLRTHCVALDLATNRVWLGEEEVRNGAVAIIASTCSALVPIAMVFLMLW